MPGPTYLDFARMADAAYYANDPLVPTYTRVYFGQLPSGFKAARYTVASSGKQDVIVAFAGTDTDESELTDSGDKFADIGFAGMGLTAVLGTQSKLLGILLLAARQRLLDQVAGAIEFTRQAQYFAGPNSRVMLVGHSLGGGLAQIIAAKMGLQGVAINGPTVSQMGVSISNPKQFFNINNKWDPISKGTQMIGKHLGTVVQIDTGAMGFSAHLLPPIVAWLGSGPGASRGLEQPF